MAALSILSFVSGCVFGSIGALFVTNRPNMNSLSRFSRCDYCAADLRKRFTIPVISYIFLSGQCKNCRRKIPPIYIVMELSCGGLWTLCSFMYKTDPFTPTAWALCTVCLMAAAYDYKTGRVPDSLHLFLLMIGAVWCAAVVMTGRNPVLYNLIGFFAVSAPLLLISVLTKGGIGGADIKFTAVCGLILGWRLIILALFLGIVLAAAVMLPLRIMGKIKPRQQIPILPFLSVGVMVSMFWGNLLLIRYTGIFI